MDHFIGCLRKPPRQYQSIHEFIFSCLHYNGSSLEDTCSEQTTAFSRSSKLFSEKEKNMEGYQTQ